MKILIAAGGTAGHLYPGIVIAEELRKNNHEVFLVVRKNGREKNILQSRRLPFFELNLDGLPRKISFRLVVFFFKLFTSIIASFGIIRKAKPDLVLGMGSYLSFPVIFAARLSALPTLIHEQNLHPGLANRVLAPYADKIAVSFPETVKYFPPEKIVYTGNPIRNELRNVGKEQALKKFGFSPNKFTVLIFGGSLGAKNINTTVIDALPLLIPFREKIQILHLTGEKDFPAIAEKYRAAQIPAKVLAYLEEMGYAYACADLVISRAGASTIAEVLDLKKPAILVPYPYATDRHQELQARYLARKGYVHFLLSNEFLPVVFAHYIEDFLARPEKLKEISRAIENLHVPQATKELLDLISSLVRR